MPIGDVIGLGILALGILSAAVAAIVSTRTGYDLSGVGALSLLLVIIAMALGIVGNAFLPKYFAPACPYCGSFGQSQAFCTSCGGELIEKCSCGRKWCNNEIFCPDCGEQRD